MKKKVVAIFFIVLALYHLGDMLWTNAYEVPFSYWLLDGLIMSLLLTFSVLFVGIYFLISKEKKD